MQYKGATLWENRFMLCENNKGAVWSTNQGRGFVDRKLVKAPPPPPPSKFNAGRPKAALLFWFFGGFRCDVPLLIVILVIY